MGPDTALPSYPVSATEANISPEIQHPTIQSNYKQLSTTTTTSLSQAPLPRVSSTVEQRNPPP